MPAYTAKDTVKSGVPFGGIGAGKMEILPNGLFNAFTFQNNWSDPIVGADGYPGILGYHFGISVEYGADGTPSGKKSFLLQTVPVLDIPIVRNIHYEGIFPRAALVYEEPDLGLEISLEVFSPWVPGDTKNSSLPAVFFNLKVKNTKDIPAHVGLIFIGRNTCGEWCVGRQNRVTDEKKALHLEFSNQDPSNLDARQGALRFSFVKNGWQMSFLESWNAVTKNFSFNSKNISLAGWDTFVREGALPKTKPRFTVQGENQELCGAIAARRVIVPKSEKALTFGASWYFPHHPLGHQYQKWFKSAAHVSRCVLPRIEDFRAGVRRVEELVFSLPFPRWFNDALLTNLAPFFSSSWHVKDGRFAFYEAPVICPLMGTLDVGFYGSIPLSFFFPDLEISQITQFAKAQRPDGYIPHDLGKNRLDLASNGTTFHFWKDLNPKFILMVYRDFLWSGRGEFLTRLYPHVKKALLWSLKTDTDGDGLPNDEGADQTFDIWQFYGTNPYVSGIFLAALLATEKMARLTGDVSFVGKCRGYFLKGKESFEKELWNGKYFGETCMLSQLNGQWYADLLKLGPIVDPAKIKKAIGAILKINSQHSCFGMVNSVCGDGSLDTANDHSRNIWSGMNYAFASLCVSQGFPLADLLKELHKLWDNITRVQGSPWNQPDTIDSQTGRFVFGDSYYRNMAIWSIPIVFSMKDKKTADVLKALRTVSGAKVKNKS